MQFYRKNSKLSLRRITFIFLIFLTSLIPANGQTKLNGINCGLEPSKRVDSFKMPVSPANGKSWEITNDFGNRVTNKDISGLPNGIWQHTGVDYLLGGSSSLSQNQPIYAAGNGIVVFSTKSNTNPVSARGGLVIVKHLAPKGRKFIAVGYKGKAGSYEKFETEEIYTYYLHLDADKILVNTGDDVDAGQQIAQTYDLKNVGKGKKYAYVPHLHFEIWSKCSATELNGYEADGTLKKSLRNPVIDPVGFLSNVKITGGTTTNPPSPNPTPIPTKAAEIPTLFLMDVSDSMNENNKIGQAKNAGLNSIAEIKENRRRGTDNSTVAVWSFGGECSPNNIKRLMPFTNDLTQAENVFRNGIPRPAGLTPLYTAINLSVDYMTDNLSSHPHLKEARIVVLTDGQNTCSEQIRPRGIYSQGGNIVYQQIKFYCIGFDIPPGSKEERDLQYLASISGGKYFPARDANQLNRAFQKVFRVYVPKPSAHTESGGAQAIVNRNFESALQIWTIYIKNNPTDPNGFYNLALICEATEQYKCSVENYKKYLELSSNAADTGEIRVRIEKLEEDYQIEILYYLDVLRSDLEYLKDYYKRLFGLKNEELATEFRGFVAEKGMFYRNIQEILEIRSSKIQRSSNELADSLDYLNRRVGLASFDRDAVSLLTVPISNLEDLIKNIEDQRIKDNR